MSKHKSFHVYLLSTYQSKQGALEAVQRAVRSYQGRGYATQYAWSDNQKGYIFMWKATPLSDSMMMAHSLGRTIDARV